MRVVGLNTGEFDTVKAVSEHKYTYIQCPKIKIVLHTREQKQNKTKQQQKLNVGKTVIRNRFADDSYWNKQTRTLKQLL